MLCSKFILILKKYCPNLYSDKQKLQLLSVLLKGKILLILYEYRGMSVSIFEMMITNEFCRGLITVYWASAASYFFIQNTYRFSHKLL